MVILFLVVIIAMRVLQSIYNKKACMAIPDGIEPYMKYIGVSKLFAAMFALITVIAGGNFDGINAQMIIISACSGVALAINSLCGIKALLSGTIVLSSIFSTAGLIVPCILGIFFFDEPMSVMQFVCIFALFVSTVMLIDSSKKISANFSKKTIIYLLGSLLSNGTVMFCQKLFGEYQPNGNVSLFSMFTFLIPSVLIFAALPLVRKSEQTQKKLPKKLVLYSVILAFAVFVIQQFVTLLTPVLSSAVLFTFVNGGATVVAAIVGAAMYNEKITIKSACGIILGIAAMVCIKIF